MDLLGAADRGWHFLCLRIGQGLRVAEDAIVAAGGALLIGIAVVNWQLDKIYGLLLAKTAKAIRVRPPPNRPDHRG